MLFKQLAGLMAAVVSVDALSKGFNSGNVRTDGTPKTYSDFEAEFQKAMNLPGTSGWGSIRLYTNIQAGTTADPISAFQAAIDTKTTMLLGMWASAGQDAFNNEITALQSAMQEYGSKFTDLVVGISVGSEDLYRNSVTGAQNDAGIGANPSTLVDYIQQTKKALQGTALSGASIGHVDTWDAWVNGTNSEVAQNCDWVGMDTYPYFEYQKNNSIANAKQLFWDAYDKTKAATGKTVYITETGWPVSGKTEGEAVASVDNAEIYWQEVSCELQGEYNVWWYTLQDALPDVPNPSFGIIGQNINSPPLYDLSCNASSSSTSSATTASSTKSAATSSKKGSATGAGSATATGSAASATETGYGSGAGASGVAQPTGGMGGNSTSGSGSGIGGISGPGGNGPTPSSGGASGTASGAAEQTGNSAAKMGSAMGAGLLALFAAAL